MARKYIAIKYMARKCMARKYNALNAHYTRQENKPQKKHWKKIQ